MAEEWRPIEGWPYEVSSHGRVRRSKPGGSPAAKVGRIMSQGPQTGGYLHVGLSDGGRTVTRLVHILVCEAFHGPKPSSKHQVRHLDGNPANNNFDNLRWGTAKEDVQDRYRHGTAGFGELSGRALLTNKQASDIRKRLTEAKSETGRVPYGFRTSLAKEYGVRPGVLDEIMYSGTYPEGK